MSNENFVVIYVGAGEINFGSPEGPWNHSLRLEKSYGSRLVALGIIDPDVARSKAQIALKVAAGIEGYSETASWPTVEAAAEKVGTNKVSLIIVGAPPHFRGGTTSKTNLDLRLLTAFPQTKNWLIEKPISAVELSDIAGQETVLNAYQECGTPVGVGYMLRALKAVRVIQEIIREKALVVMGTQARYYMAYEFARKPAWWNKQASCGPIVEQATHLISLSLFFGGKPILPSVRTHTVEHTDAPGKLSKLGFDEATIPPECRIPRYTSSIWTYEKGAVGSLVHVVGLHGNTYDTEFEVLCDGYTFKLVDMYSSAPRLFTRRPEMGAEVELTIFKDDDPFQTQIDALIAGKPYCSYEDALETYALTWAIRNAGEKERA
ncbi:putative oxidoreductase C terminal-domain-containing protein [Rhodocollybia butyracea]|uniref:Oxidoreductase C terminal-domain-containing protein n=1 Tax=Rhodocollybia butyracea TaxID=206335 RepID=A0A9P5PU06_9AGAR|nr:putative oxidoreductase C terminal-domain-containing protein [Rhodocollybia butyracea]